GLEAMRQAADAAVAVVPCHRREDALRALYPEDATRRSGSRPAIRRRRRHGSFDAADPDRNVAGKGNSNGWNRDTQLLLQIELPSVEAMLRHVPILLIRSSSHTATSLLGNPGYMCLTLQRCQTSAALSSSAADIFPAAPRCRRSAGPPPGSAGSARTSGQR